MDAKKPPTLETTRHHGWRGLRTENGTSLGYVSCKEEAEEDSRLRDGPAFESRPLKLPMCCGTLRQGVASSATMFAFGSLVAQRSMPRPQFARPSLRQYFTVTGSEDCPEQVSQ